MRLEKTAWGVDDSTALAEQAEVTNKKPAKKFWSEFEKKAISQKATRLLTGAGIGAVAGGLPAAYYADKKLDDNKALATAGGALVGAILGANAGLAYNLMKRPPSQGRGPIKKVLRDLHSSQAGLAQHSRSVAKDIKANRKELRGMPPGAIGEVESVFKPTVGDNRVLISELLSRGKPISVYGGTPNGGIVSSWLNPKFTKESSCQESLAQAVAHNKANQEARKSVHITYKKGNGRTVKRRIDPLEVKKDNLLMAYDHKRKALRTFRMDRVQHVKHASKMKWPQVGTAAGGVLGGFMGAMAGRNSDVRKEDKKEMATLGAIAGGILGAAGGHGLGQLQKSRLLPKRMEEAAQRIKTKIDAKMTSKIDEAARQMLKDQAAADSEAKGLFAVLANSGETDKDRYKTLKLLFSDPDWNTFDPAFSKAQASEKLYNSLVQKKKSKLDEVSSRLAERFKKLNFKG